MKRLSLFTLNFVIAILGALIEMNAQCIAGMKISFAGGSTSAELCATNQRIRLVPASNAGHYAFAITDPNGKIEKVQLGSILNLTGLTGGDKRIYGISWWGVFKRPVGQHISEASFSDFCFELSENFLNLSVSAGSLGSLSTDNSQPCLLNGSASLEAFHSGFQAGSGFEVLYVLTKSDNLIITGVSSTPDFSVTESDIYRIHTLIYNPATLDLSIVEPGVTTGFDVNSLLVQGGGSICGLLDVNGVKFNVQAPEAGTLIAQASEVCFSAGGTELVAESGEIPVVPNDYNLLYVLTSGSELIIQQVNSMPRFMVEAPGTFTIHSLVYNPATLDLSIVVPGVTTGVDVNGLLVQGGGSICASLDVTGARFTVHLPEAGTLIAVNEPELCTETFPVNIQAAIETDPVIPDGYQLVYVLTEGEDLIIQNVSSNPSFDVDHSGLYTIHSLVFNESTLDLGVVELGVTTGFDVNSLLTQGGGSICASLDVPGARFQIDSPDAGILTTEESNLCSDGTSEILLLGIQEEEAIIPMGYQQIYVLTSGENLVIQAVNNEPSFEVKSGGIYTIHSLVYNPSTLDLGIVQLGQTTGVDVNNLLVQGGGNICASLDVSGVRFTVTEVSAGTLVAKGTINTCQDTLELEAEHQIEPVVPAGYSTIYVLTKSADLTILNVNDSPKFTVTSPGLYTIHTMVYDPATLDLGIVVPGRTSGIDVNALLVQGNGNICASLDVVGASFEVGPFAGTLIGSQTTCLGTGNSATLMASHGEEPIVPSGYSKLYVLTSGSDLIIEQVNETPVFEVGNEGLFTIHTLVYDPLTLDLGIVQFGSTTGVDVNGLLTQGGGTICGSLDVTGAAILVEGPKAGTMMATESFVCLGPAGLEISAIAVEEPMVPAGYDLLYVLTRGSGLIIEQVSASPAFMVEKAGMYTIHPLVYNASTLDLSIVVPGLTTGFDVNSLLVQGGGSICASLDVTGASISVGPGAGELEVLDSMLLLINGEANLEALVKSEPFIPMGYQIIYVLTRGEDLVIEQVSENPQFSVSVPALYTIHTLVYDPSTLDLSVVVPGVTTGVDVNGLLVQGGGSICAALDVTGARFSVMESQSLSPRKDNIDGSQITYFGTDEIQFEIQVQQKSNEMIQLFDMQGKLLYSLFMPLEKGINQIRIPLNQSSPSSMYALKVGSWTKKIIKSL